MTKRFLIYFLGFALLAPAQTQPPKPAPKAAPTAPAKAAAPKATPASGVDEVVELLKGGMSEALVLKTIQKQGKAYDLSPTDLLKLQKGGASEAIITAMMDLTSAAATASSANSAAPAATTAKTPEESPVPAPSTQMAKAVRKRKIAVMPFDYAAVATWVQYWFHNDVNIGQGIRAMLTARMHQAKNITLIERARMDAIEKELNLNNTALVNQGTKVKMGRVSGADCILLGDIVIFGRDDKSEGSRGSAQTFGRLARHIPGVGNKAGSIGQFSKEEKAVVAIVLRIVDTETSEVLETAEARGESSRSSKNWDVFISGGSSGSAESQMTSSNFQATIIGEATSNAVAKVIQLLDERIPHLPIRTRAIEGRVAKISGNSVILGIGLNEGVENGDRFEILKILSEVVDPKTKEVLDSETAKVGEVVVSNIRDKIAVGTYTGQALSETYQKGYTARLLVQ